MTFLDFDHAQHFEYLSPNLSSYLDEHYFFCSEFSVMA